MYKKQMILQRVTCFLLLAAAALVFIYSLGLVTDLYDSLYYIHGYQDPELYGDLYVEGSIIYLDIQDFNKQLTSAGIVLILTAVALFVFNTHNRRRYYIANYITIGINALANVGISVWMITNVLKYRAQYTLINFEQLKKASALLPSLIHYTESTFWFDVAWVVLGVVVAATLLSLANLVIKLVLMGAERKLIKEGGQ